MIWSLVAIAVSALCIAALGRGDPKRIRAARSAEHAHGRATRWTLVAVACFPGLLLALAGDSPAFLTWLGGCAVIGWGVSARLNGRQQAE